MNAECAVVLRDVRVDPRPRVLGRADAVALQPPDPPPGNASAMSERLVAAHEEGRRLGADAARREADATLEARTTAQADLHAQDVAALHDAHALRLLGVERERDAARAEAAAAGDLGRAIDALASTARAALLDDALCLAHEATVRFVGEAATAADADLRRDRLRSLIDHAAAAELDGRALVRVRVHPDDLALLGDGDGRAWNAVADGGVERGGCRLDTAHGSLDARLAIRLERLRSAWCAEGGTP